MTKFEFIHKMNLAAEDALKNGARFNKAALFAQAALESDWGNSELAVAGNNLFAIKAGRTWNGPTINLPGPEWKDGAGWFQESISWRRYSSWTECLMDYAAIISQLPWFQDALQYLDNPSLFIKALLPEGLQLGWATDPRYYQKIREIAAEMESYGGPKWP